MNTFLDLWYTSETKSIIVNFNDEEHDFTSVAGKSIEELAYPFVKNGARWRGLYEELRSVSGCNQFTVVFHGEDDELQKFKDLLADPSVEIISSNNKVFILYNDKRLFTDITINGKIMPTSVLNGISIDKWIHSFEAQGKVWKGIFAELDERLGGTQYSITFVGNPACMNTLVDECPDNVDITFKPPMKRANAESSPTKNVQPKKEVPLSINNVQSVNNDSASEQQQDISKAIDSKNKIKGFFGSVKSEYRQLHEKESGIALYGIISCAVAVICTIIFTIYLSRFLMLLSLIPAVIFGIIVFTKGYKKLGIFVWICCCVLGLISWTIITIRWNKIMDESFGEIDYDAWDDAQDAMNEAFDTLNG